MDFETMSLKEQLFFIETHLPDAWEYLHDIAKAELPHFDENDEMIGGNEVD